MADKKFDLEVLYSEFLQRSGLSQRDMIPVQYTEMKKAFIAGCAQMLITMRHDVSELSEDDGVAVLEDMLNQAQTFFEKELVKYNREKRY